MSTYHCFQHLLVIVLITDAIAAVKSPRLAEQLKIRESASSQQKRLALGFCCAAQKLVKDVVIALSDSGMNEAHFFQQVRFNGCAGEFATARKANVNVLSKTR